jgi:hypothetical protein
MEFVIVQPRLLLLKIMLSDFDTLPGFISCKLSIHMFSKVCWVKKKNKQKQKKTQVKSGLR